MAEKARFIGGGKVGKRHAILRDDQIYCEWQGDVAPTIITHSAVKCAFCKKTLAGLHYVPGELQARTNPRRLQSKRKLKSFGNGLYMAWLPANQAYAAIWSPTGDVRTGHVLKISSYRGEVLSYIESVRLKNPSRKHITADIRAFDRVTREMKRLKTRDRRELRRNPVPSYAMILRGKLAKGYPQEEAEELARRELQQANEFLRVPYTESRGRHNPPSKNGPVKIYGETEKIFMRKTSGPYKGQKFVHDFKGGVEQIGFPRGTVLQAPDGRKFHMSTRCVVLSGKKDLYRNFPA